MIEHRIISFHNYKISSKLPLESLEVFVKDGRSSNRCDYLVLGEMHLKLILKSDASGKAAFLFEYGCICFVNFKEEEIYTFLRYLEEMQVQVDYALFSRYNESHTIQVDIHGNFHLWVDDLMLHEYQDFYQRIFCSILAKSTELYKLETEITSVFDQSETFINDLKRGKLHLRKKKLASTAARVLGIEYRIVRNIKIFDRGFYAEESLEVRKVFDRLSEFYELSNRCTIIQEKMKDLRRVFKAYSLASYKQTEYRLLWLEIFLLGLFPLSYLAHWLWF